MGRVQLSKGEIMNRNNDDFGYMPMNSKKESNPCFECGVITKGKHHVVPVSRGGTKVIPLCETCHNLVHGGLINSGMIREGLRKAAARGKKLGAPVKISPEKLKTIKEMRSSGLAYSEIAIKLDCSVGTVSNAMKKL
jgi:hypothetical protein